MYWIVCREFGCLMEFLSQVRDEEKEKKTDRFCLASERNEVDEFFTQSSMTIKPVVTSAIREEMIIWFDFSDGN